MVVDNPVDRASSLIPSSGRRRVETSQDRDRAVDRLHAVASLLHRTQILRLIVRLTHKFPLSASSHHFRHQPVCSVIHGANAP